MPELPELSAPVVILVRPQMGENIGAALRAMSNFGLSELRLVAPRDGWPNRKAKKTASGAEEMLKQVKVFPDFASAVADIQIAYATTARPRDMEKRVVMPAEAMTEIHASALKTALVFGPERTGMANEDLVLCDTLITIPTDRNKSLNLAQSVVILGYEWWKSSGQWPVVSDKKENNSAPNLSLATGHLPLATLQTWQGLFEQLDSYLDEINYYRVADRKPVMWQNLRTMLLRGRWSDMEVRSFRGMVRALWERRAKNEPELKSGQENR